MASMTIAPLVRCFGIAATMATLVAQGIVRQVGPTRPFLDIQSAVNAALDGDVVEVDPGSYPPFVITGKRLVVTANQSGGTGAKFTVNGAPAIVVTGLQPWHHVTIANARAAATAAAPGISISNQGTGSVRLLDVEVLSGHFGPVAYDGLIEVRNTDLVWCDRVRAGDYRYRCNGAGGTTGLAALHCESSTLQLTRCVLHGNRSDDPSIASGDGVHLVGFVTVWATDCHLVGGLAPLAGLPGVLGGHAVHDAGGSSGAIRMCDTTLLATDPAAAAFAVAGVPSFLMACLPDGIVRTEMPLGVTAVAPGATTTLTVRADVPNQVFVVLFSAEFGELGLPYVLGELLVGGTFGLLTAGVVAAPVGIPITVPLQSGLVGLQCTAQSVLVTTPMFAASTAAAFTVR